MDIEQGQEIVKQNIRTLYHFPKGYKAINEIFQQKPELRLFLLKILNYAKDKELIIYRNQYCFFMDNTRLTVLRNRTTKEVTNRYANYLCCMGLLHKVYQEIDYNEGSIHLTNANIAFMEQSGSRRPVNTFSIREYTDRELEAIEVNTRLLIDHNVTTGNVSADLLRERGLDELAQKVYYANNPNSFSRKKALYKRLTDILERQISEAGFTTKKRLLKEFGDEQLGERIFRIFKDQIQASYMYKPANSEERQRTGFKGKKWIIIKRGKYEKEL